MMDKTRGDIVSPLFTNINSKGIDMKHPKFETIWEDASCATRIYAQECETRSVLLKETDVRKADYTVRRLMTIVDKNSLVSIRQLERATFTLINLINMNTNILPEKFYLSHSFNEMNEYDGALAVRYQN